MSKNLLALPIIVILLLAGGYFAYTKYSGNKPADSQSSTPSASSTETTTPTPEGTSSAQTMGQNMIKITATGFEPKVITIKAGETITWINQDTKIRNISSDPHPQHTAYPDLNKGNIAAGKEVSLAFPKAGTYKYHDHLQATQTGTVVVE